MKAQRFRLRRLVTGALIVCGVSLVAGGAYGYSGGEAPGLARDPFRLTADRTPAYCVRPPQLHAMARFPQCSSGGGTAWPYWGFNYMSPTNPDFNDCPWEQFRELPKACSGWNYWDRSQIDKRNGGYIRLGFCNSGGDHIHCYSTGAAGGIGVIWISRIALNNHWEQCCGVRPIPPYNKVFCDYESGNHSYAQCQAVIL
jgi:hypothetical protein